MFLFRTLQSYLLRAKHNYLAPSASIMRALPTFLQGLLIASVSVATNETDPVVTVKEGKLKGANKKLLDGSTYYSFKGIPYAQPPIGKLRFKAPLPPKPWSGIYEAIEHRPVCPQVDISTMQIEEGSEDCLFLNVYTKSLQANSNLPVMVFIHGGAYMSGSGNDDLFGPEFLLQHNVILVTINYRLEVLGFLSLDIPEVPGNAGMKDQVAALRWVKNNIAQFGGDPDNVLLFGESAGSTSVTYHMISPMSKGLFHKVIAESGVFLEDWAIGTDARERAFRVGKLLGKETNDVNELLEHLQSVPAIQLANATFKTRTQDEKYRGLPMYFVPVVEKKFRNVESFIDDDPMNMVLEKQFNKVPLIVGYNSDEGLLMLRDKLKKAEFFNKKPEYLVPRSIAQKLCQDKLKEFGGRIKQFYFGNGGISNDTSLATVNMQSDINFIYNTHRFAHFYATTNEPIFMYKFSCDTELNMLKILEGLSDMKGACHADELFYLFYNAFNKEPYQENDNLKELVYKVTKLWTDFAKTSNPTPDSSYGVKWTPYTRSGKAYINIDVQPSIGSYSDCDRVEFWNKLYCEAGLPCITKSSL